MTPTSSSSRAVLEKMVHAQPSTPDALSTLDASLARSILEQCDETTAHALLQGARVKAVAVSTRIKEKAPQMSSDEWAGLEEHVFREALGRILKEEVHRSAADSEPPAFVAASMHGLGARYDQIAPETLAHFMQRGYAAQVGLFKSKPQAWAELLRKDCARAQRVQEMREVAGGGLRFAASAQVCRERFPAVYAVADRLACLPRELNYKLGKEEYGEATGEVIVYSGGQLELSSEKVFAGYFWDERGSLKSRGSALLQAGVDVFCILRGGGVWRLDGFVAGVYWEVRR